MKIKVRMKSGEDLTFKKPISHHIYTDENGDIERITVISSPIEGVTDEIEIQGRYVLSVEVEE